MTLGGGVQWDKSIGFVGYAGLSGSAWVQMLSGSPQVASMLPQAALSVALEGDWAQGPLALHSSLSARSATFNTSSFPILGVSAAPFSVAEPGAAGRLQSVGQPAVGSIPEGWSWQAGSRYRLNRNRTYTFEMAAWDAADSASSAPGWRLFGGQELRGNLPGVWWTGVGVGTPYSSDGGAGVDAVGADAHSSHRIADADKPALLLQVGTRQTLAPTSYGPVEVGAQLGTALQQSGAPLSSFAFEMKTPLSSTTRLSGTIHSTNDTLAPTLSLHFAPSSWGGGEVVLRWDQRVENDEATSSSIFLGLRVRP